MTTLPSNSHSQAAAIEPKILATTSDFVDKRDSVATDNKASPAPTASLGFFTKDGVENE